MMNLSSSLFPIASALVIPVLALSSLPAIGLTGAEVNKIAEEVTVFIRGIENAENFGSGVLIERKGNLYKVLTAAHVVEVADSYTITTVDNLQHKILERKKFPNIDLAVVTFNSSESYAVARVGDSAQLNPTARVFVAGFPKPGFNIPVPTYTITDGNITTILNRSMRDGYGLAYTNPTRVGMSGGPVFNDKAEVIGIHGRKEGEADGSLTAGAWLNLGIPINLYHEKIVGGGNLLDERLPVQGKTIPNQPRTRSEDSKATQEQITENQQVLPPASSAKIPRQALNLVPLPVQLSKSSGTGLLNPQIKQYCDEVNTQGNTPSRCQTVVELSGANRPINEATQGGHGQQLINDYLIRGHRSYEAKKYSEAIAHYSSALELVPNDGVILHNRAVAFYAARQPESALRDLRRALKRFEVEKNQAQVLRLAPLIQQLEQELVSSP